MPTSYIINPPANTDLRIDPDYLISSLHKRWADIKVHTDPNPGSPMLFWWFLDIKENTLYCAFHRTQNAITMESGNIADYAEIAVWFRNIIPSKYELILYDEEETQLIDLHVDTTAQQITELLKY